MKYDLTILETLLTQKLEVLQNIIVNDESRLELFSDSSMQLEQIDSCMEETDGLIDELNRLNTEFDEQFLIASKSDIDKTSETAQRINLLVIQIDEKMAAINKLEEQVQDVTKTYFAKKREEVKDSRNTVKAAMNYYQVQNNATFIDPQFMDDKK